MIRSKAESSSSTHVVENRMDVIEAADGTPRVVWHWWDGGPRYPMTGKLNNGSTGFSVQ